MNPSTTTEPLWDVKDVAAYLKTSRSFVYKAVEADTLPFVRVGSMIRFKPDVVRAYVDGKPATKR
jgi:excisionase family DNA binding protein